MTLQTATAFKIAILMDLGNDLNGAIFGHSVLSIYIIILYNDHQCQRTQYYVYNVKIVKQDANQLLSGSLVNYKITQILFKIHHYFVNHIISRFDNLDRISGLKNILQSCFSYSMQS